MLGRRHTPKPEALALTSTLTLNDVPQRPTLTREEVDTLRNAFFWLIETFSAGLYVGGSTSGVEATTPKLSEGGPPNFDDCIWHRRDTKIIAVALNTFKAVAAQAKDDTLAANPTMKPTKLSKAQLGDLHRYLLKCTETIITRNTWDKSTKDDKDKILDETTKKMQGMALEEGMGWTFNKLDVLDVLIKNNFHA